MAKRKYLVEAIHEEEICNGQLNIVEAPVGSGKTTWALRHLAKELDSPLSMLYLIDTTNGNEQIVSANNDIATYYSDIWFGKVFYAGERFSEDPQEEDKVVVMTYAQFGALAEKHPEFAFGTFSYIICDEIHNLINFMRIDIKKNKKNNLCLLAKLQLEEIVEWSGTTVIGLSATPRRAVENMDCPIALITVDDDVFQLETKETICYSNKLLLLDEIQKGNKGLVYIHRVSDMESFCAAATERNFKAICIWSVNNEKHPMS